MKEWHIDLMTLAVGVACLVCCAGCVTETGSVTVVGEHFALPTLSSVNDEVDIKIYESVEGAVVKTRKNSLVKITYHNKSKTTALGCYDDDSDMTLTVEIEPLSEAVDCVADARNDEGDVQDGAGD